MSGSDAEKKDYKQKLAELDDAIAAAEEERQKLLRAELDRYEAKEDSLVSVQEWAPRELKRPPTAQGPSANRKLNSKIQDHGDSNQSVKIRCRNFSD